MDNIIDITKSLIRIELYEKTLHNQKNKIDISIDMYKRILYNKNRKIKTAGIVQW